MTLSSLQTALESCGLAGHAPVKPVCGTKSKKAVCRTIVSAATMTILLSGCGVNRVSQDIDPGNDGKLRHPIALVQQPYSVDVFPTGSLSRLDPHTDQQVASFARRYNQIGRGPISLMIPSSMRGSAPIDSLRRSLAQNGAVVPVTVSHYIAENPELASPVRLSFDGLKAKVAHRCGDWPSDISSGSGVASWENRSYWNFGCANQSMLASQVADPRDIATPSGETPPDATMRLRGINNVRTGKDPATVWSLKNTNIGTVGGTN